MYSHASCSVMNSVEAHLKIQRVKIEIIDVKYMKGATNRKLLRLFLWNSHYVIILEEKKNSFIVKNCDLIESSLFISFYIFTHYYLLIDCGSKHTPGSKIIESRLL